MVALRRSLVPAVLLVAALAAFLGASAIAAGAEAGVSESPRLDVMQVIDGEVLDSVVVGNRIIVVGDFTQVRNPGGNTINQPYIAAYNADTGQFDGSFRPDVDNYVNAIARDGNAVFIVGQFGNVDGESHRRIAKINSNGSVNSNFQASMGTTPNTLDVANGKVYVGGSFTSVNGQPREALAAVNANNGSLDSATNFDFADSTNTSNSLTVRWIEVSPNNDFMFVSHSARLIDGQVRTGIARFDISANSTSLSNWRTTHFEDELGRLPNGLRMRRLAISPNNGYVVVVTSGNDIPPTNDVAVRFPASGGNVSAAWTSRHFDTVLGVAINNDVVFIGGHFQFQEAPGSTNPFPGDPDTTFGFGGNQGPQILGSEVVQREQLGALNPATGKSLDWNPGSDSFIGVQSLTWDNQYGLLVGHDGNRLGGVNNIGRHAIFPIGNTPGGGGDPDPDPDPGGGGNGSLTCTVSFNGGQATVTFSGDTGTSLQLRNNGSWAATVNGTTATINANENDTLTARVRGPNYDGAQDFPCTTGGGGGGGNPDPDPDPDPNAALTCTVSFDGNQATATFSGDLGNSLQLRRNGSWAATVNGTSTTVNASSGDTLTARVRGPNYDGATDFPCTTGGGGGGGGNPDPDPEPTGEITTTFTAPANGGVVNGGDVTISGAATAPDGLRRVRLTIQRDATGEYLNPDGSYTSEWAAFDLNLNGTASNWSVNVNLAFAGEYNLSARTFDDNGVRNDTIRRSFIVGVLDNAPPELFANNPIVNGGFVNISGSAQDDLGVSEVSFLLQNRDTLEYFRLDGTVGAAQRFTTTLSNPGGTNTNWSRTITGLPAGSWQFTIDAIDSTSQRDRTSRFLVFNG